MPCRRAFSFMAAARPSSISSATATTFTSDTHIVCSPPELMCCCQSFSGTDFDDIYAPLMLMICLYGRYGRDARLFSSRPFFFCCQRDYAGAAKGPCRAQNRGNFAFSPSVAQQKIVVDDRANACFSPEFTLRVVPGMDN